MKDSEKFKSLEDKIYSCIQECREEMKHHFFRFVELESKFKEMTDALIDLRLEISSNVQEKKDGS